jgi:hypothetical protein
MQKQKLLTLPLSPSTAFLPDGLENGDEVVEPKEEALVRPLVENVVFAEAGKGDVGEVDETKDGRLVKGGDGGGGRALAELLQGGQQVLRLGRLLQVRLQ